MPDTYAQLKARGGWTEDQLAPDGRFPVGPWNTWSNLGYAIPGAWLAWRFQDSASAAMAVALILLATGSALYHGYKSLNANRLDWVGMYMVAGSLVAHGFLPSSPVAPWVMLALGGAGIAYYGHRKWMSADWHMALAILLASIRPVLSGNRTLVLIGVGVFGLGYVAWWLDKKHVKFIGIYGHALWHVLTGLACAIVFAGQR